MDSTNHPSAAPTPTTTPPAAGIGVATRKEVQVAIAIVFDPPSGNLLICRRKPDAVLGGFWEFPGGKCEPGEPPEACATREVLEETALHVRVIRALPTIDHDYPHARVRLHPFICEKTGGTLTLLEVAEAQWIPPATVRSYPFPPANASLLELIAQGHAAQSP